MICRGVGHLRRLNAGSVTKDSFATAGVKTQACQGLPVICSTRAPTAKAVSLLRNGCTRRKINRTGRGIRVFSSSASDDGLQTVLESVCDKDAVQHYLELFRSNKSPTFAVVKVGGDVVEYELDELVKTCTTLSKLGLMPVVIHGGGPQMNDELVRVGVEPQFIRGSRVTDVPTLEVAQRIFTKLNARVAAAFEASGVETQAFPQGIFSAEIKTPELGFVGEIDGVKVEPLLECLAQNKIPVLTSLGNSSSGQVLNINADVAARNLVLMLKPMRVLFASAKGGWIDDDTKEVVSVVDLANDYERLAGLDYNGRQGTLLKLNEINLMLDSIHESSTVSITAANTMLKELFTHEGAGSLFRKGAAVTKVADGAYEYPGGKARATFDEEGAKGYPGPLLGAFSVAEADGGHDESVWRALKRDLSSLAWCWPTAATTNNDTTDVYARSERLADVVLRGKLFNVAFYNQGHPLDGWNYEAAQRLMHSREQKLIRESIKVTTNPTGPSASASNDKIYKVGLLGARGYVGREFVNLLCAHPQMELAVASSRALSKQRVQDCFSLDTAESARGVGDLMFRALEPEDIAKDEASNDVDIWILALPNGLAPNFVPTLEKIAAARGAGSRNVMIDLGADYRFTDEWTYGLPERPGARASLNGATKISNPGCYATGAQIALMPLLQNTNPQLAVKVGTVPTTFGISGYSGAGTNPSPNNDPDVLADNLIPYTLVNHMHERECSRHLGQQIAFMPHVASWFQGIHLTTSIHLANHTGLDANTITREYEAYYKGQPLVRVTSAAPKVKDNAYKHHVGVGGFTLDPDTGRLVVVSTIDNLLKGAATQAMQNLNIALGIADEYTGIDLD